MQLRLIVLATALALLLIFSCTNNEPIYGEQPAKEVFYNNTDSVLKALDELNTMAVRKDARQTLLKQFATCRRLYKKNEAVIEYYFQGLSRRINGPALPDVKTEDSQVWPPHGFQVLEQLLYDNADSNPATDSLFGNEIQLLQTDLRFVKTNMQEHALLPRHAAELVQHQLIRIVTLGITGFDSPISLQSLPEAVYALAGVKEFCAAYYGNNAWNNTIEKPYQAACNYIGQHTNFDTFDRLEYITRYLMPLSRQIALLYPATDSSFDQLVTKPFSGTLEDLVQGRGFNADYYASYAQGGNRQSKMLLGKRLFSDNRLSGSGTISCANCHQAGKAFTDGIAKASNLVHGGSLLRNTPTLYYAALQSHQFYDMRSATLEDQIYDVMKSGNEFASSDREIAQRLRTDTVYLRLFGEAFGKTDSITGYNIRNSIATYVRSLSPFASAFDAFVRGNKNALNATEIKGFNLFMGKAKCGTCHFMPLFNGNTPPWYSRSESEIIGVPAATTWQNSKIDGDEGRYRINPMSDLKFAFKTPTLRNVWLTPPYMHNGVYNTLDEVVEFYHKGGGTGIGIILPTQSLPFDSLTLSVSDKKAIVAFMQTLTDKQ